MIEIRNLCFFGGFILALYVGKFNCLPTPQNDIREGDSVDDEDSDIMPTCLSKKSSPYTFFGTKTTYLHPDIGNMNTDIIQLPRKTSK